MEGWVWDEEDEGAPKAEGSGAGDDGMSISGHCPRKMQSSRNFQTMPKVMPCDLILGGVELCDGCITPCIHTWTI